jgi:hypothetical protein
MPPLQFILRLLSLYHFILVYLGVGGPTGVLTHRQAGLSMPWGPFFFPIVLGRALFTIGSNGMSGSNDGKTKVHVVSYIDVVAPIVLDVMGKYS